MNDFIKYIEINASYIIIGLSLLTLVLLVAQIRLQHRFRKVSKKYRLLTRGASGADLEEILQEYAADVLVLVDKKNELMREHEVLRKEVVQCIHHPGLIRFNAFDNMGSDLSFSLAMLDLEGDGVVLTGLYGRDETRIYAKPIHKGTSDYSLTEEELKAIQRSLEKSK